MAKLKVGDKVLWKGSFGKEEPTLAKVIRIEKTQRAGEKYGEEVDEIDWNDIDCCCVDLDTRQWAYGHQLFPCEK